MKITEIGEEERGTSGGVVNSIVTVDAKRVLVGAGARILFYPTLLYNVFRNKVQAEFRWWDEIDQFLFLGAVPFPTDVPRLKQLGVGGVITLNEPYETLVRSSLYHEHEIDHLAIPTRDYLFAPSLVDISRAVDFIHKNASRGRITYVHCKAGRGRSTTIVLCYLVQYKNMTPMAALEYVRSRRPRVLLASSQWQAVQEYSKHQSEFPPIKSVPTPPVSSPGNDDVQEYSKHQSEFPPIKSVPAPPVSSPGNDVVQEYAKHQSDSRPIKSVPAPPVSSPGNDAVLITEADLEGYNGTDNDIPLKHPNTSSSPLSPQRVPRNNKMIAKLSCFFSTWKVSTRWSSLPEIHAC